MRIIRARHGDVEQIAEIFRVGYSKKPYSERWSKEAALAKINDHLLSLERTIFVAVEGEAVLGFAVVERDRWPNGMAAWLEELIVSEKRRNEGIGFLLIERVLDHCRGKRYKGIWMGAHPGSVAWKWYRRFGFEYDGYRLIGKYFRYGNEGGDKG